MIRYTLCFLLLVAPATTVGCGGSDSDGGMLTPPSDPPVIAAGSTIPLGTTVRVEVGGRYDVEAGASSIRTRCWGYVAVTIPGDAQPNSCESSDGSGNQTHSLGGASFVDIELGPGAMADVTLL